MKLYEIELQNWIQLSGKIQMESCNFEYKRKEGREKSVIVAPENSSTVARQVTENYYD